MMQLHTVVFKEARSASNYTRLARVLCLSAAANSPETPIFVHTIHGDDDDLRRIGRHRKPTFLSNARKTKHHAGIVEQAPDGVLLCLMDCDTMVLGDMREMDRPGFDFAYTLRPPPPESKYPFNSGVVFVRVSPITRLFYRRWYAYVQELLMDPKRMAREREHYGGINQCGLARVLEDVSQGTGDLGSLEIVQLPCHIWNCENTSWKYFSDATKVVHLVPTLREYCLRPGSTDSRAACAHPNFVTIRALWRAYDTESMTA